MLCCAAALNMGIRALLRQYEARPPPLAPLAASLRSLSPLCEDPEAVAQPGCAPPVPWMHPRQLSTFVCAVY